MPCNSMTRADRCPGYKFRAWSSPEMSGPARNSCPLFLEISSRLRGRWRACRVFLPGTPEIARPLRAQQHIVLPDRIAENVLELLVHLLCLIRQCDNARDLASELAVEKSEPVPICRFPWRRWRLIHRTLYGIASDLVEIVASLLLFAIDLLLFGHVLLVFERGPNPLPTADRLVPDVESDESQRLAQTGRLGRLVRMTWHQHQSVDRVEILALGWRVEHLPRHLDHDRAGIAGRHIRLRRLALVGSCREIDFQRGVFFAL